MADYNLAIKLDSQYIDAIYNRGGLYEFLGYKDKACKDFNLSFSLGHSESKSKVEKCSDTAKSTIIIHDILRLTKKADNEKYGFTPENPIKVGIGSNGGPANQRAYLNLLRDQRGKQIKYERIGSCCNYKSENGILGLARLDQYEIIYENENGKKKKAMVYISFYDYEEPQILFNFKTVGQK